MALKVFRFDASGCNGCDIEILSAALNPELGLDVEVVDAPEKAQAMLVTGGGNDKTADLLKEAHSKLQEPKLVISMGACAASMCVFKEGYPMRGPVDKVIPVSHFVLGCPPRPQNLALAVRALAGIGRPSESPVWTGPEGLRARIAHDREKCTACGACANMCPSGAIDIAEIRGEFDIAFNLWKCSFCGTCQQVCPEDAVELTRDYELHGQDKASMTTRNTMGAVKCQSCGASHIAANQVKAINARVAEADKAIGREAVQSGLAMCRQCKLTVDGQRDARRSMLTWALKH